MFLIKTAHLLCTLLSVTAASALPTVGNDLKTFKYTPFKAPASEIPAGTPLQFNGSFPGQGDIPGQLGWWTTPITGNQPIDLVSFVQYNKYEGVVFWAERTAFELYLALTEVTEKTYAVKLGQPNNETPEPGLAGNWTVTHDGHYFVGWEGDYSSWFVCEKGDGYYGLYFGEILKGCENQTYFLLEASYVNAQRRGAP